MDSLQASPRNDLPAASHMGHAPAFIPGSGALASGGGATSIERYVEPPVQQYRPQPKPAISSTALIVRSADGVILQPDYICKPNPESGVVNFRSLKGANAVVRARIDELAGRSQIMVESASGIPLALIDTTYAIYSSRDPPPRDTRQATISRVTGNSFHICGAPCANVLSLSPSTYVVLGSIGGSGPPDHKNLISQMQYMLDNNLPLRDDVLLTVHCENGYIHEMRDKSGVVVRQEAVSTRRGDNKTNLWVSQGADITLITSIVCAVAKLA